MTMGVRATDVANLLRNEIQRRNLTQYRIAADTGIKQASLSRFLRGGSLRMETVGKLLDYLGYRLVLEPAQNGRVGSRREARRVAGGRRPNLRNRHNPQTRETQPDSRVGSPIQVDAQRNEKP